MSILESRSRAIEGGGRGDRVRLRKAVLPRAAGYKYPFSADDGAGIPDLVLKGGT